MIPCTMNPAGPTSKRSSACLELLFQVGLDKTFMAEDSNNLSQSARTALLAFAFAVLNSRGARLTNKQKNDTSVNSLPPYVH